jgi:hypothetical protein
MRKGRANVIQSSKTTIAHLDEFVNQKNSQSVDRPSNNSDVIQQHLIKLARYGQASRDPSRIQ